MEKLKTIIRELTDLQGNVGYEDAVIHSVADHLEKFGKVTIDHLGNLICHLTPKNVGKKKVMLFGHTDEVGMMVKAISDDGFVFCEKLGSLNPTISTPCLSVCPISLKSTFITPSFTRSASMLASNITPSFVCHNNRHFFIKQILIIVFNPLPCFPLEAVTK